jgi:aquaporin Z
MRRLDLAAALRDHWPEYCYEAALLGGFMLSAIGFTVLLFGPDAAVARAVPSELARRFLMGLAMGGTAIALIYSPWGKQSGAHFNPAMTLTFLRLGRIAPADALCYVAAQFAGGVLGTLLSAQLFGAIVAHPAVSYAVTVPGAPGALPAFAAELAISFGLMWTALTVSNLPGVARWTGVCCAALVAVYITFEAPLSGMSMNPARSFGSAFGAGVWQALWVYFTAPLLGMLLAAAVYTRRGRKAHCAKLHHQNDRRCIHCGTPAGGAA